uniref:Uncharacterized protein n=1 Tax=Fagus sylvatica TaxID=28930 RepID=A0A2N9GWI0_FAGSY
MASPSLSNSRLTLTLTLTPDFGEPMYGSRVLCETIYGSNGVFGSAGRRLWIWPWVMGVWSWVVDVWLWAL